MGSLSVSGVLPNLPNAIDEAREVGAVARQIPATAMRSGVNEGAHVYVREVPFYLATVWRIFDDGRRGHRWWRLEAKVKAKNNGIRKGDALVVAEYPYGNGWVQNVAFKPGSKKGALERPDLSTAAMGTKISIVQGVEKLSQDYWEKGEYLTAGISEPELPFSFTDTVRNTQRQALFLFGACEDIGGFEQQLFQTGAIQRLLQETERGTIRFWAPRVKLTTLPRLSEDVKTEAVGLMAIAIRQALAGPHKDSDRWIGRPVTEKVDQIYRAHLNRRNRVVARKQGKLSQYDDALNYADVGDDIDEYGWAAAGR